MCYGINMNRLSNKELASQKKRAKARRVKTIRYTTAILGTSMVLLFSGFMISNDYQESLLNSDRKESSINSNINNQDLTPSSSISTTNTAPAPQPLTTSQS